MLRRKRPSAMGADQCVVEHRAHIVFGQLFALGDFVRTPESVEEVDKRDAGFERCSLRDEREIHDLLDRVRSEHRPAGLPYSHDVLMIAKDRERLGGKGAGRHVEHRGSQLARNLIHVGDHEKQALRRGESGRQRAGLQSAVNRARRAAFALHLHDGRNGPPDVWLALRRPLIGPFPHRRRRGDGINSDDFISLLGNVCSRFVPIDSDFCSNH